VIAHITKTFVDRQDPDPARVVLHFDDRLTGFGLKVQPSGVKSYFVQYRDGKGRKAEKIRQVIGRHGAWTADRARQKADEILSHVGLGNAPVHEQRANKTAMTLAELCEQYFKDAAAGVPMGRSGKPKKPGPLAIDRARIEHHILPLLGKRLVKDLSSADIQKVVNAITVGKTAVDIKRTDSNGVLPHGRIRVRGGAGTAARTVALLGGIMSYAKGLGVCATNPVNDVTRARTKRRERWLTAEEFRKLGEAMTAAVAGGATTKWTDEIRLLAFTGCRKNEIEALKWAEVDLEGQVLQLSDSKTGASRRPLGRAAVSLLRARAENRDDDVYVFPAARRDSRPSRGLAKVFDAVTARAGLQGVTPHTLRHSLATIANSMGYAQPTIAAMLGHRLHSVTAGYSHIMDRPLLAAADAVADRIARMLDGRPLEDTAEVVELRRA
jgi:integrase